MLRIKALLVTAAFLLNTGELLWEPEQEEVLLPVLMYHEVKYEDLGKDVILPEEMESDLRYLAREGYTTVHMADVLAYVYDRAPLPEKPILLTFDDGYGSNYQYLFPLLREYGAKAVISVIGRSADEFSLLPERESPYVHATWAQLLEMRSSGLVELQNHSYDMHKDGETARGCGRSRNEAGLDYERRVRADADRLQEELYRLTGSPATTFAYPYGFYDSVLEGLMEEIGFSSTLTCDFGVNRITHDPACLRGMKRICRSHGIDLESLLEQAYAALN